MKKNQWLVLAVIASLLATVAAPVTAEEMPEVYESGEGLLVKAEAAVPDLADDAEADAPEDAVSSDIEAPVDAATAAGDTGLEIAGDSAEAAEEEAEDISGEPRVEDQQDEVPSEEGQTEEALTEEAPDPFVMLAALPEAEGRYYARVCVDSATVYKTEGGTYIACALNENAIALVIGAGGGRLQVAYGAEDGVNIGYIKKEQLKALSEGELRAYVDGLANGGDALLYDDDINWPVGIIRFDEPMLPYLKLNSSDAYAALIWKELKSWGLNDIQAAGIMGNIRAECDYYPTLAENYSGVDNVGNYLMGRSEYTFVHDAVGWGIVQWTYYTHKQGLWDFAKSRGQSVADLDLQLAYFKQDMYKWDMFNIFADMVTLRQVSDHFMLKYEIPRNRSEKNQANRRRFGQQALERFAAPIEVDTLSFIDVAFPRTYIIGEYNVWDLSAGVVASNVELTSLKSELRRLDGTLVSEYGPVAISGKNYYAYNFIADVDFSGIEEIGEYNWILTATDAEGKTLSMPMRINVAKDGDKLIEVQSRSLSEVAPVDITCKLDGAPDDCAKMDVYIDGMLSASGVSEYHMLQPVGVTYEVRDVQSEDGLIYNGVSGDMPEGVIIDFGVNVELNFLTEAEAEAQEEAEEADSQTWESGDQPWFVI